MSSTAVALPRATPLDVRVRPANDNTDHVAAWLDHDAWLQLEEARKVRARVHVAQRGEEKVLVAVLDREGEVCWRREWPWHGLTTERADLKSLCEGWCAARELKLVAWEEAIELAKPHRRYSKTRSATWAAKRAGLSPMGPRGAWLPADVNSRPAWLRALLTRHGWSLTEAAREAGGAKGSLRAAAVRYLGAEYEASWGQRA